MKLLNRSSLLIYFLILCVSGCASNHLAVSSDAEELSSVVFLVRHAEKVDSSRDPELSDAGKARAEMLAAVLRSAEINYIHSSDYIRTRDTGQPLATAQGLDISLYDPRDLPAIAEIVKATPGRHLVVGHSNTTPQLAALLGGQAGPEINEATEYDRLYILTIGENGAISSILMRYGEKYQQ